MSLRPLALRAAFLALLSFAQVAVAQSDPRAFSPLLLDGQTSLDVEATPGLDLGPQSTLEFVVATAWEDGDGVTAWPAVLGRREPYEGDDPAGFAATTQYSVHIAPDRRSIGLFDGTRYASVPFDFSDGQLHHVALVTAGGRTTVYVDREARGVLDVGLGTTPGLPLHVGSSDGGSELFMGVVPSVRLWRTALTEAEVAAIADLLGAPGEGDPDPAKLAAFSDFTGDEPQLVVLEEPEAAAAAPLPKPPARGEAEVGTRGLKDKLKQKTQASKQKRIAESIEETEALKRGREGERQRVLARLAKYQGAEVTQESVEIGPGIKFRRPKTTVGGQALSASEERSKRRLEKRLAKLDRYIADYTEKLEGGPPDYAGGAPRRIGLRQQLAEAQEAGAALAAPQASGRRRQRPLAFVEALPEGEVDTPDGARFRVRSKLGEGSNGGAYLIEAEGAGPERRPEVLKQALKIESDLLAETNQKRAAAKPRRKPLTQEEAVEARTRREVELQNEAAEGDNPFVEPAQLVAANRLKMPYAGATLGKVAKDIREDATIDPEVKVAAFEVMMRKMLEAAASLEQRGIVHRDLHDGNMALDAGGNMKLIDFGLAKRASESDQQLEVDYGVGAGSQYGGRPSPETLKAADDPSLKSTHKSDVYSIGWQLMVTASQRGAPGGPSLLPSALATPLQDDMQRRMQPGGKPSTRPHPDPQTRQLIEFLSPFVDRNPDARPSASEALARMPQLSKPEHLQAAEALLGQKAARRIGRTLQGEPDADLAATVTAQRPRLDDAAAEPPGAEAGDAPPGRPPPRRPGADADADAEPEEIDLDAPPARPPPRRPGAGDDADAEPEAAADAAAPLARPAPRRRPVPAELQPGPGRLPRELYRAYIIDPAVEQVIDQGGHTTGKSRGIKPDPRDAALDDTHDLADQVMQYVVGGPGGRFPRDTDFVGVSSSIDAAVATAWHTGRDALSKPGARIVVYKVNTDALQDRIVDTEKVATAAMNDKKHKGLGEIALTRDQRKRLDERWPKGEFTVLGDVGPEDVVMENGRPWKYTIDPKPIAGPDGKLALKELEAYVKNQVRAPARQAAKQQGREAAPAPAP